MTRMRWNWLVLVVGGCVSIGFGIAGVVEVSTGALKDSSRLIGYFAFGVVLVIGGMVFRHSYRRYEAKAMATAAEELGHTDD